MFPLLWWVPSILLGHLEIELAALVEKAILLLWSKCFIVARNNMLSITVVPYWISSSFWTLSVDTCELSVDLLCSSLFEHYRHLLCRIWSARCTWKLINYFLSLAQRYYNTLHPDMWFLTNSPFAQTDRQTDRQTHKHYWVSSPRKAVALNKQDEEDCVGCDDAPYYDENDHKDSGNGYGCPFLDWSWRLPVKRSRI